MKKEGAEKALSFLNMLGSTGERVSVTTYRILFAVYLEPGMTQLHYVEKLGLTKANLHRHVVHLVNMGLVVNADSSDAKGRGNFKSVNMTKGGEQFCEDGAGFFISTDLEDDIIHETVNNNKWLRKLPNGHYKVKFRIDKKYYQKTLQTTDEKEARKLRDIYRASVKRQLL